MKTTIELPDDIFLKAKILAVERRTTLKELFVQALQSFMQSPPENDEEERRVKGARLLAALQATNTETMVPLTREEIYERPTKAGGS